MCLSIVKSPTSEVEQIVTRILQTFDYVTYKQTGLLEIYHKNGVNVEYTISIVKYVDAPTINVYRNMINFLTIEHMTDVDKIISIIKAAIS
jgi:hypothetical protein